MAFARQYIAYTTGLGQDHRDPTVIERRMCGKFDSEEEYDATVRREEAIRLHIRESARLALLESN